MQNGAFLANALPAGVWLDRRRRPVLIATYTRVARGRAGRPFSR